VPQGDVQEFFSYAGFGLSWVAVWGEASQIKRRDFHYLKRVREAPPQEEGYGEGTTSRRFQRNLF